VFILEILRKKLKLHADYIKNHGHHLNRESDAKKMMICVYCLGRLIDDEYHENAFKSFYKKWGEPTFSFEKLDSEFSQMHIKYPNVIIDDDEKRLTKDFRRYHEHSIMLQKQDLEYLTSMIRKHILSWWD
jgi:hypothetical protein